MGKRLRWLGVQNAAHYENAYFLASIYNYVVVSGANFAYSDLAKTKWFRVVPGHNLWLPALKHPDPDLLVEWFMMRDMAAQRLQLKLLLQTHQTDLEIGDLFQRLIMSIDPHRSQDTGPSDGEDGEDSEEGDESSGEEEEELEEEEGDEDSEEEDEDLATAGEDSEEG